MKENETGSAWLHTSAPPLPPSLSLFFLKCSCFRSLTSSHQPSLTPPRFLYTCYQNIHSSLSNLSAISSYLFSISYMLVPHGTARSRWTSHLKTMDIDMLLWQHPLSWERVHGFFSLLAIICFHSSTRAFVKESSQRCLLDLCTGVLWHSNSKGPSPNSFLKAERTLFSKISLFSIKNVLLLELRN